ncbi:unnamed protein product, partial [Symbiodinium sp. KB8]
TADLLATAAVASEESRELQSDILEEVVPDNYQPEPPAEVALQGVIGKVNRNPTVDEPLSLARKLLCPHQPGTDEGGHIELVSELTGARGRRSAYDNDAF